MSSRPTQTTGRDVAAVAETIRQHDRFLVTTHENPDGDALGSLLAATIALRQLGKNAVMFLGGPAPLPGEYRFMDLGDLRRDLPADTSERVLLCVDCANETRLTLGRELLERARLVI